MNSKIRMKTLIVTHFEVGEMTGDFPGEAQFFYEHYCAGGHEYKTAGGVALFTDREDETGLCVTGSGKVATALCLSSLFSDERFDFSDTLILGAGCAGGSYEFCVPGDVCVVYDAVDFDLGHSAGLSDFGAGAEEDETGWFRDFSYDENAHKKLNAALADSIFCLLKESTFTPQTTEQTAKTAARNGLPARKPEIIRGTAVTGDNFWKGRFLHSRAVKIAESYGAAYPYAVCEMEDAAMAVTASRFGLLDNLAVIRVCVNTDIFTDGETPYTLWRENSGFNSGVENGDTSETSDLFPVAMESLFAAGKIICEANAKGKLIK